MLVQECILICGVTKLVFKDGKFYYQWDRYQEDICLLADELTYEPSVIIGIARGGCVPAVHLSHLLGKPFKAVTWQTRDGGVKEKYKVPEYALIVDDINDSGQTLIEFTANIQHEKYATLTMFTKRSSDYTVDFYAQEAEDHKWIVFPWE